MPPSHGDDHLGDAGEQGDAGGERAGVDVLDEDREHVAADDADDDHQAVEQQRPNPTPACAVSPVA